MLNINPVQKLLAKTPQGVFFRPQDECQNQKLEVREWDKKLLLFGHHQLNVSENPPNWHMNPISKKISEHREQRWWLISDFDSDIGDVKCVWELSRFDWLISFAQQASLGDSKALIRINSWVNNWCDNNPPYKGHNWKCGQEASIRVIHIVIAAFILKQTEDPQDSLIELVELHLERIAPTISYAISQDNNHGTSEAAALFIGGSWLKLLGISKGSKWAQNGRKILESRGVKLIGKDGSFSQYSTNYHRVMLDTYSIVEIWRRHLKLKEFSPLLYSRLNSASLWLLMMTNKWNGDVPNIGANDGAQLLKLTSSNYRDFRPSVQLASVLFTGSKAYLGDGDWNQQLFWLNLKLPKKTIITSNYKVCDNGGFIIINNANVKVVMRYPRFGFRPSHTDALHVDLWHTGVNLLRDGGTYSYNTKEHYFDYFSGVKSHNTIEFDGRNQMPRLSRFLFGNWIKTSIFDFSINKTDTKKIKLGYVDSYGAKHTRLLRLTTNDLLISDTISGFKDKAVLRWRLNPGKWIINGKILSNGKYTLKIDANVNLKRFELVKGWESRYYHHKQELPVLEVEVDQPCKICTEYRWSR